MHDMPSYVTFAAFVIVGYFIGKIVAVIVMQLLMNWNKVENLQDLSDKSVALYRLSFWGIWSGAISFGFYNAFDNIREVLNSGSESLKILLLIILVFIGYLIYNIFKHVIINLVIVLGLRNENL